MQENIKEIQYDLIIDFTELINNAVKTNKLSISKLKDLIVQSSELLNFKIEE